MKEQIDDYFEGIITYGIPKAEQTRHNRLVTWTRRNTNRMLHKQTIKIRKEYNDN